jgi:hypothetical protein
MLLMGNSKGKGGDFIVTHPFSSLASATIKGIFWPMFFMTILLMVVLNVVGIPLTTKAAPYGIISYELAGKVPRAAQILSSWDYDAQIHAAFSLGLDYVFLLAY